jgi:DNA-binding protein H-NS
MTVAAASLKSMSLDKITALKAEVDETLSTKVAEERRNVQEQLVKLDRLTGMGSKRAGGARGSVAPKYRNPENPAETWAGRGLKPRWLSAALKSGGKLEDFTIKVAVRGRPKKTAKKSPG